MSKGTSLVIFIQGIVSLLLISYGLAIQFFLQADINLAEACGFQRCLFTKTLYALFDRSIGNQIISALCIYFGLLVLYFSVRSFIRKPIQPENPLP